MSSEILLHTLDSLSEKIANLHNIMASPGLMELWLDGRHTEALAFSVMEMKNQAYQGEETGIIWVNGRYRREEDCVPPECKCGTLCEVVNPITGECDA